MKRIGICRQAFWSGLSLLSFATVAAPEFDSEYEVKRWQEVETALPAAPGANALIPVFVSAATDNRFFVDPDSVSVGGDGVVRYTLVVVSPSGARNVSHEGIRCESAERRLYAFGRSDGSWSKARSNQWVRIQGADLNRQHAALYSEFFCPNGAIVRDTTEARAALRSGGHPSVLHRYR